MKFTVASLLALPLLAVATPLEVRQDTCSTGTLQCCQSTASVSHPYTAARGRLLKLFHAAQSTSPEMTSLASLLGVVLGALGALALVYDVCASDGPGEGWRKSRAGAPPPPTFGCGKLGEVGDALPLVCPWPELGAFA